MKKKKDWLLVLGTILVCYVLLVIGDWLLSIFVEQQTRQVNREAHDIVQDRIVSEDVPMREEARKAGFVTQTFPDLFDDTKALSAEMKSLEMGVLGSMPYNSEYYCNEGYGLVRYKSDRFGLRNEDAKWDKPVDVLFIGDSFTQGACVENDQTIPSVFEQETGRNVLNAGMQSNNPLHYAALAHTFVPKVRPKVVYVMFYANDKGDHQSTIYDLIVRDDKPYFRDDRMELANIEAFRALHKQAIVEVNKEHDKEKNKKRKKEKTGFEQMWQRFSYHRQLKTIKNLLTLRTEKRLMPDSSKALAEIKGTCGEIGCKAYIVYIPDSKFWVPDALSDDYADKLKQETQKLGLEFIDLRGHLDRAKGSEDFAIKGAHLSPLGYEKVAKFLVNWPTTTTH